MSQLNTSSKSLELYSTIFEAAPGLCREMFPTKEFLDSREESLKEIDLENEMEADPDKAIACSRNPYLFRDSTVLTSFECLRDKILELC